MRFNDFRNRSINDRDAFWTEQAALVDWQKPFNRVCNHDKPPFTHWFEGGLTNLCHNAVDRHLKDRADQNALIYVSTETDTERSYSFRELHAEVQRMAAVLLEQGVKKGDRVLIYMPMIPEATFAMLACARIGAVHSVVFGGFASHSLANRIDDASPVAIVSADAGSRGGKVVEYKPLLDEAIRLSSHKPASVILVNRGLAAMSLVPGRDHDYTALRERHLNAQVPCEWLDSTAISYTIYTSGTTGKPKGVQRDTGGYLVALAASMKHIFMGEPGETYFSTSDIGWVVGHSYIVYGPLIAGMATILYEGLPIRPDGGIWWRLVEKYKVTVMFSAPTAVRVLKKQDPAYLKQYDLSSQPSARPYTRWRNMSRTSCVISSGLRGSAMQRAAASIKPSLRSTWPSSITPPSLVMLPPSKHPCTTRRPNRPKSMRPTSISSVQFGFGIARSLIKIRHLDFRAHKGNAVLVCGSTTVKYPG